MSTKVSKHPSTSNKYQAASIKQLKVQSNPLKKKKEKKKAVSANIRRSNDLNAVAEKIQ